MKNLLSKKFYAFIVTAMMFSANANAQLLYTDISPNDSITRTRLNQRGHVHIEHIMDINNDGISDLKFILTSSIITSFSQWQPGYTAGTVKATPLNGSAILTGNSGYPAKMNLNNSINANATWSAITDQFIISNKKSGNTTTITGNWNTTSDGFLGLRFIAGGQTHYCWIQLNVQAFSSGPNASILVIKDFAYNSVPNQPIRAGETSCTTPTVNLTQSGPLSFCNGDSVTLTANGTGYQYQWKKNNVNIAGATAQTYVAKTAGIYKCKVTNSCGSKSSGTRTVTIPCRLTNEVFTEQLENPYELQIAPNPISSETSGLTTISFSLEQSQKVSLKVVDLNGRLVKTLTAQVFEEGEHSVVWNVEEVNAGIYFLQVQTADYLKTEKLVVTK
ncbi:MAG: T9SS type A sorting domain-containing protein [Bacteroidetes bacterium]|nr:T9SS type A sorting domain-containing protein [Bacteroidota bacterium]